MRAQQTLAKPSQKSTAAAGFKPKVENQLKKLSINLQPRDNDEQMEDDKSPKNKNTDANQKLKDKASKSYQEDDDLNMSDLDEDQRKELQDLETHIENESLTRGERRRLQNKRNVLKSKIKKELETENHKSKISKLQKKVLYQKKIIDQSQHYKLQRDALKDENKAMGKKMQEYVQKIK
jgi:hypothetical protein|tara:strand:+ start:153 stop:689 length:537 start_codon:yes stop_codon:yes gene_type:complete